MKKFLCTILFMIFGCLTVVAQQDSEYTMYMFNGLVLNPAYAGTRDAISITAIGRYQWVNIDGAPRTASLSAHMPIREKMGVGINAEYDKIGVHNRIYVMGSYSYRIPIGARMKLSMGLQGGVRHLQSTWTDVNTGVADPVIDGNTSKLLPNFGAGLYLYSQRFYIGASVPHFLNNELDSPTKLAREYRHYLLTGGVVINLTEGLKLKPSFLLKSVPAYAPLEADITLSLIIRDRLFLGGTWRSFDSADFIAEIKATEFMRIGYAYDLTLTELSEYTSGTHEVMVGFDIGNDQKTKVVTPRYF